MTLPTLSLLPNHRSELSESFEDSVASLAKYFTLTDANNDDDMESARAVASALDGSMHSSDVDCEYYPCTLSGPNPTSDEFFAALGVARDARTTVSGWDNPKLDVRSAVAGEGLGSALALITRLGEAEIGNVEDYLGPEGTVAIKAGIARLETFGPIVGVQLCTDDGASKVVLTLARRPSGIHIGVLTVRVET